MQHIAFLESGSDVLGVRICESDDDCETVRILTDRMTAGNLRARFVVTHKARVADHLYEALRTLVESLEWEEKRSGTTYHGYEQAKEALEAAAQ